MELLLWPCPGHITQRFVGNYDWYPFSRIGHNGTDVGVVVGTPIIAAAHGIVRWADTDPGWGNYIRVYYPAFHFHGFYAHLRDIPPFSVGDRVGRGHHIGYTGNTGRSTAPHLHFSVRLAQADSGYVATPDNLKGYVDPELFFAWVNEHLGLFE